MNKKECEINKQITSPQENSEPKQLKATSGSNSTIDACFQDSSVQKAEIMWALKHAQIGFSDNSCKGIVSLFQSMFPDSQIVQKIKLEPNKLKYVVNYEVAPYVKNILEDDVKNSDWHVVSFDESMNDVTHTSEMDICLRFWNEKTNKVQDRYWNSDFLGHTTHQDLHDALQEGLKSFDMGKMVQLSMDGPNVNLKLLQKVKDSRDELGHSKLIDFGSCNLHTVHGSFKTGAEASGWSIKQLLKSCHQILKNSPARRDDFISITGCSKFPLTFCATRSAMGYSSCFIKTEYEIKCSL